MKKQILSIITMIVMIIGIIPIGTVTEVLADTSGDGYSFDTAKKTLTITDNEGATAWRESDELDLAEIETIVIGPAVTSIEDNIFADCYALKNFNIDSKNPNYKSNNGVLYNKSETEFLRYPPSKNGNSCTILKTVVKVHDYAFDGAGALTSIKISDNTVSIGAYAFRDCVLLKSLTIPVNVVYIGENAFLNCFATIEYSGNTETSTTPLTTTATTSTSATTTTTTNENTNTEKTTTNTAITTTTTANSTTTTLTTTTTTTTAITTTTTKNTDPNTITKPVKPNNMTDQEYVSYALDKVAEQIKAENDTGFERLNAICKWVASFNYSVSYQGPAGYILYGGGDCWASTNTIVELARRCDFRAKARVANRDTGAGSGHMNAVVEIDGVPYVAEAGYDSKAPRPYDLKAYPSGFMTDGFTSGTIAKIHDYIGFDTEVFVPAVIDGKNITAIKEKAFATNNIEKITVAEGVKTIEAYAFYACGNLKELHLPSTISTIQESPFSGANLLEIIDIPDSNPYFKVKNGIIYSKDGKTLVSAPFAAAKGSITLPNEVTTIGKNAFYNCYELTNIYFPNNFNLIESGAFYMCKKLKSITIPSGITVIDDWTFAWCESLTKITIPNSITNIGYSAFAQCKNLESATIPASVIIIDDSFYEAKKLTISGYSGSAAEKYASKTGTPFNPLTSAKINLTSLVTLVKFFPEVDDSYDMNYDGKIDVIDIAILRRKLLIKIINNDYDDELETVIIRFEKNDGSGQYIPIDTSKGEKAPVWTRGGYNFVGWSMDESAKNADLADPLSSKVSCTYYAVWKSVIPDIQVILDRTSVILLPESVNPYTGSGTFNAGRSQVNVEVLRDGIASNELVTWTIDNADVAKRISFNHDRTRDIDLKGENPGSTVLTVTTDDGYKATCKITVVGNASYYNDFAYIADDKEAIIIGYRGNGGEITIPSAIAGKPVLEVRDSAFDMTNNKLYAEEGCKAITKLTVPDGIKILGTNAFQSLSALKSVSIPASIIEMDTDRFTSVVLTEINVDPLNSNYCSIDGVLFNKTKTVLYKYPPAKKDSAYIIPDSVVAIEMDAFRSSTSLKSVTMPINLFQIGSQAFRLCSNLESVYFKGDTPIFAGTTAELSYYTYIFKDGQGKTFPNLTLYYPHSRLNWTSPEWREYPTAPYEPEENIADFKYTINGDEVTITGYTGLEKYVSIPAVIEGKRVTAIANNAFKNQSNIVSVVIPEGVTNIGKNSFALCDNLLLALIPSTIKNINSEAFYNCPNLSYILFKGNCPTLGLRVFDGAKNLMIYYDFYDLSWKDYHQVVAYWNVSC